LLILSLFLLDLSLLAACLFPFSVLFLQRLLIVAQHLVAVDVLSDCYVAESRGHALRVPPLVEEGAPLPQDPEVVLSDLLPREA
jgi:hypothetical protein